MTEKQASSDENVSTEARKLAESLWFSAGHTQPSMKNPSFLMLVNACTLSLKGTARWDILAKIIDQANLLAHEGK